MTIPKHCGIKHAAEGPPDRRPKPLPAGPKVDVKPLPNLKPRKV